MARRGAMTAAVEPVTLRYAVTEPREGWELGVTMPESVGHNAAVGLLEAVLTAWTERGGAGAIVARNLAVRWLRARPQIGVDPDLCLLAPPPPSEGDDLRSVRTWVEGHAAPVLAIEVVSNTNPRKDYVIAPEKYAASGTGELWIFDPYLAGPASHGGPHRLQLWQRSTDGTFARTYAGDGPAYSSAVGGHLVIIADGRLLRLADDAAGTRRWPTREETERAAKDAALSRLADLERELATRDRG